MNETNNNPAAESVSFIDRLLAWLSEHVPLPLSWIIGGVILLIILIIAKKLGWLDRIRVFFLQTREELLKCSWPNREELRGSTWMVLVAVAMLGAFTFLADLLLGGLMIQEVLLKWIGTGAAG